MNLKVKIAAALVCAAVAGSALAAPAGTTAFSAVLKNYEAIGHSLASDSVEGVTKRAASIARVSQNTLRSFDAASAGVDPSKEAEAKDALGRVESAATALTRAANLEIARAVFGDLSTAMIDLRKVATGNRARVAYCPMAKKSWIQPDGEIENPYYGKSMEKCGEFVE